MVIGKVRKTGGDGLVAAARSGDRQALAALWHQHRRWIAAVLLTYKPRGADLEDLLQEVAMKLVDKVSTLQEERNIRAWLRAVAVNVARSEARRVTSRERNADAGPGAAASGPDEAAGDIERLAAPGELDVVGRVILSEHARQVLARLAALPDEYREPLVLRAVSGLRSREIALVLDLEPATVDTRVARARRMLRDPAGESGDDSRSHCEKDST